MQHLGQVIREARKGKGLSLRDLEPIVGVTSGHLSQLETGKIERPSMALLFNIAEALDLEYADLLRLSGHVEPAPPSGARHVEGAAFLGDQDLTPEEAEEVKRFIELLRRRRG